MSNIELNTEFQDGTGRPLVFVHGWLGSITSWDQVREHLALENPKLFYDQRCHGDSPCTAFDFADLAADLHGIIQEYGCEDPVLVGHSMGGMVALTYATRYDNFSGLFLLGTCASTPEPAVESPQFYLDNFHSMDRRTWAEMIADNYLGEDREGTLREEAVRELVAADEEPVLYALRAMVGYDVRGGLDSVESDAAVVAGRDDRAIRDHMTRDLANLLGSERYVLDASHLLLQEVPEEVAGLLKTFSARFQ